MRTEKNVSNDQFLTLATISVAILLKTYIKVYRPPDESGGAAFFGDGKRILNIVESIVNRHVLDPQTFDEFEEVETQFDKLREYRKLSLGTDSPFPLAQIEDIFRLNEIDIRLFLVTLAVRFIPGFDEVIGYLNNDMTIRDVTPILAATIVNAGKLISNVAPRLTLDAPLLKYQLIEYNHGVLKIPDRVFAHILESGDSDNVFFNSHEYLLDKADRTLAESAAEKYRYERNVLHYIIAGDKIKADAFMLEISRQCGCGEPFVVDSTKNLKLSIRDSIISQNPIRIKDPTSDEYLNLRSAIAEFSATSLPPVFVYFEDTESIKYSSRSRYDFPFPDYERRLFYWLHYADSVGIEITGDIHSLAYDYKLGGDEIQIIIQDLVKEDTTNVTKFDVDILRERCKEYSSHALGQSVRIEQTNFDINDVILPDKPLNQLNNVISCVRNRRKVIEEWGFARKRSYGLGISALFSGPPGTGKTMAAGAIANNLKLPLFKIDLAMVVSKYIGETEKNLKEVFITANKSNAILFFDEADALFGKRTEVKDAHDRYANIEVSYLLQQMEEYSGLSILATNKEDDLDRAFKRRIQFVIKFPFPNKDIRKKIWDTAFPLDIPVSSDLDFGAIAAKYALAGGNISNAVLLASYFAAEKSVEVSKEEIKDAIKQQYDNLGEVYPGDF